MEKTKRDVHFFHAVGAAYDDPRQADYSYYHPRGDNLHELYMCNIAIIFQCAKDLGLNTIAMCVLGGAAFSQLYPGGVSGFQLNVFVPAFEHVMREHVDGMSVKFMGRLERNPAVRYFRDLGYATIGDFQHFIYNDAVEIAETLVVNAWDPSSIPGNGNRGDQSLDGFIRRLSAIQFFACGLTNPFLRENVIRKTC